MNLLKIANGNFRVQETPEHIIEMLDYAKKLGSEESFRLILTTHAISKESVEKGWYFKRTSKDLQVISGLFTFYRTGNFSFIRHYSSYLRYKKILKLYGLWGLE